MGLKCLNCYKEIKMDNFAFKHEHGFLCCIKCIRQYCGITKVFLREKKEAEENATN